MLHTNRRFLRKGFLRDAPKDDGKPADSGGAGGGTGNANDDANKGGDGSGDGQKKAQIKGDFDPERMAADLAKSRDDTKREKEARLAAETAQQEKLDAVLVALGLKPDPQTDPAATAAKVAKELTDAHARVKALTAENVILRLAGKAGGDPDALLDSTSFMAAIAELDPSAADFKASVTTAIKDAVKANPKFAATATTGTQGPARQGADISGGAGNTTQRSGSLAAALSGRTGR